MRIQFLLGAFVAFVLVACSATPPPSVPLTGAAADVQALAGRWQGQYWSGDSGRSGVLRFELAADGSGARGDVTMLATRRERFLGEAAGTVVSAEGAPVVQALTIRFVQVASGGKVHGAIDPYRDPDCNCMLTTAFDGERNGDRIEGTFTTSGPDAHSRTSGQWRVDRVKEP
jgi:hypothetical protein